METTATEEHDPDPRRVDLARSYVRLSTEHVKRTVMLAMRSSPETQSVLGELDWAVVMEPCIDVIASSLTAEEIERAIAWTESPLFAKLATLQEKIATRAQIGMLTAIMKAAGR